MNDPFADIPFPMAKPGELPADLITTRQVGRLRVMLGKAGIRDAERLDWISGQLGRRVTTTKTLSAAEVAFLFAEIDIALGGVA